jgi:formylglycine-generating enzyme required for sulfatase activity
MKVALQCLLAFGVIGVAVGGLAWHIASAQVPVKLPQVDKLDHTPYSENIKGAYKGDDGNEIKLEAKFDMVPIPGGVFLMGSPDREMGRGSDEGPQHPVKIRPFWMGKFEVLWDEYDIFRGELGMGHKDDFNDRRKKDADAITGPTQPYGEGGAPDFGNDHRGHPAIRMTQHAAWEYCRWLSKKTGKTYRLPTEAEWEWAARAGTTTAYFFGDDPKQLDDYAWYVKNSPLNPGEDTQSHKPGTRKPNPWGLYDMYGNVSEWCLDQYDKNYYQKFPSDKLNLWPVLIPSERRFGHVVRGGSFADDPARCRSAARRGSDPSWIKDDPQKPQSVFWLTRMDWVGFRVVCPVEEQDNLKGLRSKVTHESSD